MSNFRIIRGSVRDFPLRCNFHREGWWWQLSGPVDFDFGYSPEGPFLTKAHARRHLLNVQQRGRVAQKTGQWPRMPGRAGWCPGPFGSRISKPTMKTLKGSRFFGEKFRRYFKELS